MRKSFLSVLLTMFIVLIIICPYRVYGTTLVDILNDKISSNQDIDNLEELLDENTIENQMITIIKEYNKLLEENKHIYLENNENISKNLLYEKNIFENEDVKLNDNEKEFLESLLEELLSKNIYIVDNENTLDSTKEEKSNNVNLGDDINIKETDKNLSIYYEKDDMNRNFLEDKNNLWDVKGEDVNEELQYKLEDAEDIENQGKSNINYEEMNGYKEGILKDSDDAKILENNTNLRDNLINNTENDYEKENTVIKEKVNNEVNISDLEIIKTSDDSLKINFKIDNDLDLKDNKKDLKIYIASKITEDRKIIIFKDKSQEKYLLLNDIISLSGKDIALGKDDYLSTGSYTVIFSDDEMKSIKNIGLENIIVKIEADFNDKSSSIIGDLKENNDALESNNNKDASKDIEGESKNLLSIIDSGDSKENEKNTEYKLPKTGIFPSNYLTSGLGILLILQGILMLKKRKIEF